MNCKIIIIGNEILNGFTKDSNSFFLINELFQIGINTTQVVCVKDNIIDIQNQLDFDFDLIILSGGLGPTSDDLTSKALFDYFEGKAKLELINNSIGTASGLSYNYKGVSIIALPGVPSELKNMFTTEVVPNFLNINNRLITNYMQANVIGIPESKLVKLLSGLEEKKHDSISMSYLPENVVVKLRFLSQSNDYKFHFESIKKDLNKILGNSIFSYGNQPFELYMNNLFFSKGCKISVAESCTGGYLSHLITSFSGSSHFFYGGVNAYSEDAKVDILNISNDLINKSGVVSEKVAIQMAQSVRKKFNSDYGISTTGYVGPDAPENFLGVVWVACSSSKNTVTKMLKLNFNRKTNIIVSSRIALNLIREQII